MASEQFCTPNSTSTPCGPFGGWPFHTYRHEISRFRQKNAILLYCLPPHSSQITQPLDVGFCGPLKHSWKKAVAKFSVENVGKSVTKETFAHVFVRHMTTLSKLEQS